MSIGLVAGGTEWHHMSFTDLEAAPPPRYKDYPEFAALSTAIEDTLHEVNNSQLPALKRLLQQYERDPGHGGEVGALVTKTTASFKQAKDRATALNAYLRTCEQNREDGDALQYLRQQESILLNLIKSSMAQFQRQQRRFEQTERLLQQQQQEPQAQQKAAEMTQPPPLQQSVQIAYEPVNAEELEEQTLVIAEREREIHQISQDISEINDIFLNLHELVSEQQESIDRIEDNIVRYGDDARGALGQLRRAERYQRRSSGRMACCLAILLGVLGTIVLVGLI